MTDKKDPKDFDFTDSNDFDFEDEILSKDFNKEDELVDPKHLNDDFDFGDEVVRPVGENVIKRQNTITEQDIKAANNMRENIITPRKTINDKEAKNVSVPSGEYDFDLDNYDDFDFGSSKPTPTFIRKIDCTSLNDIEKDFIRFVLALRDQKTRIRLFKDKLICERFIQENLDNRLDYIREIMKDVATSKNLEIDEKRYFLKALKKYGVELIFIEIDIDFQNIEKIIEGLSK
ncbi:hypothetical protein [Pseudomonas synxantha]|uniref:Uncharacterized protein n=1 Tax=Pseudomonas synxantha TaxID=47883 RepID=A0A5D3G6Q4_9PSED|nr:hypothetical protein [Pseudomonas synxantha]TYK55790.1 hypothetical protein FXO26_21660 [Pseudomonas synxantha]